MAHFEHLRRRWLKHLLFGSGLLGLRSIASGIPAYVLQNPEAYAQGLTDESARAAQKAATNAQFLVPSASDSGEPMNGNVPGMYLDPNFLHPTAPAMAETTFAFAGSTVKATGVWPTLDASLLSRSCFFHAATNHIAHGDLGNVHQLSGGMANGEYMVSGFARALQQPLGTVQSEPIVLSASMGSEVINCAGIQQPMLSPTFLKSLLTTSDTLSAFAKTQSLRDRDLDKMHALLRGRGRQRKPVYWTAGRRVNSRPERYHKRSYSKFLPFKTITRRPSWRRQPRRYQQ